MNLFSHAVHFLSINFVLDGLVTLVMFLIMMMPMAMLHFKKANSYVIQSKSWRSPFAISVLDDMMCNLTHLFGGFLFGLG